MELSLGVYGVQGGIHALVRALVGVAERLGVSFAYGQEVRRVLVRQAGVEGVVGVVWVVGGCR